MNLREYQDTKYPFEEYLKEIHAIVYIGSNDDMTEDLKTFLPTSTEKNTSNTGTLSLKYF